MSDDNVVEVGSQEFSNNAGSYVLKVSQKVKDQERKAQKDMECREPKNIVQHTMNA